MRTRVSSYEILTNNGKVLKRTKVRMKEKDHELQRKQISYSAALENEELLNSLKQEKKNTTFRQTGITHPQNNKTILSTSPKQLK
jgi:hypothetical protein